MSRILRLKIPPRLPGDVAPAPTSAPVLAGLACRALHSAHASDAPGR
jgi:hypothetical protein